MTTVPPQKGEGPPELSVVLARRKHQRLQAIVALRRRRRVLAPIGAAAQQPLEQTTIPQVTMRGDRWKQPVRAASVSSGTLATSFEAGDTLDGVTLALNDRILIKNQSDAKENGIYTVNTSGAPTRAVDAAAGEHLVHAVVGVEQGTANADKFFVCFTNAPIVLGSTNIAWTTLLAAIQAADAVHTHDGLSVSLDSTNWTNALSGSGITNVQELADWLDANLPPP